MTEAAYGSMRRSGPAPPWSCLLLALLVTPLAGHAAVESPIRSVNVTFDGETYVCDGVIFAPVAPAVAWEVLTDFEHLAAWVPNVRGVRVLEREANAATIEQHGVARFGAASLAYVTERRIEMDKPVAIRSSQLKGTLRRVDSLMTLEAEGTGTRLVYHLEMVPNLLAGVVLSKGVIEHEFGEQFRAIVDEMTRRAQ